MRKLYTVLSVLLLSAVAAFAAPPDLQASKIQPFPKTLNNARYVYVTAYDGGQFNVNLLPDDRQAISAVQDAIQRWGKYIIVYRPEEADMIIAVQSRPSEDVMAVYDAHLKSSTYLWRAMGRDGLQQGETPLVSQLQQAVEKAGK
ncbi:MAG TPA: hypothetical protein VJQ82_15900 [Terriglobales bacterium]|nr:hypothetical protein [Terriglobales bacterium]